MAKPEFCRLETDFVLNDPRVMAMTPTDFRLYIFLWAQSVHMRSERLRFQFWDAALPHCVHSSKDDVLESAARLVHLRLIGWKISEDETLDVSVYGVRSKHPKLRGWGEVVKTPYGNRKVTVRSPYRSGKVGEGEGETPSNEGESEREASALTGDASTPKELPPPCPELIAYMAREKQKEALEKKNGSAE